MNEAIVMLSAELFGWMDNKDLFTYRVRPLHSQDSVWYLSHRLIDSTLI